MTQEMATFYPPSSAQVDVLSTPYMEDQKFASYSEPNVLHGNMMMYLNPSSSSGSFSEIPPGNSISARHSESCVDMPRNEVMFIPPNGDSMCIQSMNGQQLNSAAPPDTIPRSVSEQELQMTSRSQLNLVDGERNLHGLSLSLSSNTVPAPFQHQFFNPQSFSSVLNSHLPGDNSCPSSSDKVDEDSQCKNLINSGYGSYDLQGDGSSSLRFGAPNNLQCPANPKEVVGYDGFYQQYEQAGIASAILKSRYLKSAQMLLDEVVNVREALKQHESLKDQNNSSKVEEGSSESKEKSVPSLENNEMNPTTSAPDLSPTERQDLQNKLDKLLGILEEVDRRYKHYYHQMQILVSSFDLVAGSGAAKPYTTLALKTISRHFRCLRDAISTQIQATRKSLGEQDPAQGGVIPRLRYVDQQLRQQRALQQFGMMRHAWRPQRGLPENAVTVLRAWLFEHFLHPYPKDSEKIMLARQTGLTRGQVANWFINARVRLWKPMVEEMYKEEFNEADLINAKVHNINGAPGEQSWTSEDRREDPQESISSMDNNNNTNSYLHSQLQENQRGTMLMPAPSEGEENQRGVMLMKFQEEHDPSLNSHQQGHGFYQHNQNGVMVATSAYHVPPGPVGSYGANNQVSLALGLRQIEGDMGSLASGAAALRPDGSSDNNEMGGAGTSDYSSYLDTVNQQQQQQHRFSNSSLLNDFVS